MQRQSIKVNNARQCARQPGEINVQFLLAYRQNYNNVKLWAIFFNSYNSQSK